MESSSPSPNFSPVTVPPNSSDPPMLRRLSPAANPTSSSPPPSSPSTTQPTAASEPPTEPASSSSPPASPPPSTVPPPSSPPASSPPPKSPSSPPPSQPSPPKSDSPQPSSPPDNSPTSPPPTSAARSPPPASENPPASPPPTPSTSPPTSSPPPSTPQPSTPQPQPPQNSSPPPATAPPQSPPPSSPGPPANSPPQLGPPTNSPPQSVFSPPPPLSPSGDPPSNSSSPPGTVANPPPTSGSPTNSPSAPVTPPFALSPPLPPQIPVPPPSNSNNNGIRPNTPSSNGGIGSGGIVAIGVVLGLALLGMIGLATWCMIRRKKRAFGANVPHVMPTSMGTSPASDSNLLKGQRSGAQTGSQDFMYSPESGGLGNSRSWFTYEELAEATNGFSEQNLLGSGGFGSVYKGCLPDGTEVAVKELKIGGGQGEREFRAEVEIISRIHHRYLVSLVGYCISENKRLLVYEYVPNNTLYFHLHGSETVLDWTTRVKIAAGAARGIAYLHEDCQPRIIHRDIKSANILLDRNFNARVADFGLAKLAGDTSSHVTTRVVGTFGYMAPEYASSGKLTDKSDVFSFGVVLLELITGRKPVDASRPFGEESLVEWARPLLSHALETEEFAGLIDQRLGKNYIGSEMFRMIEAAAACVRHSAIKRPRMGQIVRAFESIETDDLTNGMRLGDSGMFNAAQQSAEIRLFRRMAFGSQDYSTDFFSQGSYNSR